MVYKMQDMLTDSIFFGAVISLAAYEGGLLLKKKFKLAVLNPLLIGTICVMAILSLLDVEYSQYNESASYISYLLTPATVCLAVPLYRQLTLLKNNIKAVAGGIASGVLGNMIAEFIYKLFHIEEPVAKGLALGTASHAIGTAKAMEMGEIEGAMSSLAIAVAGLVTVIGASLFANLI